MPRGEALDEERQGGLVVESVGQLEGGRLRGGRPLGIAAAGQQRNDAAAVLCRARHLAPEHQGQLELGEVGVLALMGVAEVEARSGDVDQHLAIAGLGIGQIDDLQDLGSAELVYLDRPHGALSLRGAEPGRRPGEHRTTTLPPLMSLVVVGSIAFDAVKTPFGERERMLGGSAVHFSLAASFFDDVRVVGPVGEDFGDEEYGVLRERGVITDDIQRVDGGRTFFWRGHYEFDLNTAHTDDTQLNVFGDFAPRLSDASKQADVLFLANIQPDLQREVREQCGARLAGLDSMNLWIDTARDSLVRTIGGVDMVLMNDAELRMLTERPNLVRAAREVIGMGPRAVIAKQGEYGAALFTEEGFFALPAYPLETVVDPTGAGDSFAGGFLGYLSSEGADAVADDHVLRRAMTYGSVLASFNVEEFGTERVARLTREEIDERFAEFKAMTTFDEVPAA